MTSQSIKGVKPDSIEISSVDGEDKKFVSQAVAFVVGHARNGFVALCASVASLLKEQAKLKSEVESLQKEIALLKQKAEPTQQSRINCIKNNSVPIKREVCLPLKNPICPQSVSSSCTGNLEEKTSVNAAGIKHSSKWPYRKLNGCICQHCTENISLKPLTVPLRKGVHVIIKGDMCGTVRYVGHVESLEFPEIYVGLELKEAVGNSDGSVNKKIYFSVRKDHAIFVPLSSVCCVINDHEQ